MLLRFFRDESGSSAAEYALILAIVGVGLGAAALVLGNNVTVSIDAAPSDFDDGDPGIEPSFVGPS